MSDETKKILGSIIHTAFRINEMTYNIEIAIHYILGAEDVFFFSENVSSEEFKEVRNYLHMGIQKIISESEEGSKE